MATPTSTDLARRCAHCGEAGVRRLYCSARCKKRAWRRQQAGVAEDAFPDGGLRGRVPLGELTREERAAAVLAYLGR